MSDKIVPEYLITPSEWAAIKRTQATDILGSPEARELLADAAKLDACAELIAKLRKQIVELKEQVSQLGYELIEARARDDML